MKRLVGRVALVTGSTAGIGLAIARRLGQEGAAVVVGSRKEASVNATVAALKKEGIKAAGVVCNVSKAEDRERMVQAALSNFGKIDILVSNAGINPHYGSILDVPEGVWDKLWTTNVKAGALLTNRVVPEMRKVGGGSVVYVSSIAGYEPMDGIAAYGVTKTALFGLTKAYAQTLAKDKIRVNCLAPGIIKTDFSKALWSGAEETEAVAEAAGVPLGRLGTAEDCAGATAYLVSDDAAYVTGETHLVGGGLRSRL